MKKILFILTSLVFLLSFYRCSKDENSLESLKAEFNLQDVKESNIPIPQNAISVEEARLYLSSFGPSKLKSGGTEAVKGTATRNGNIVTCTAPSGCGTTYTVTANIAADPANSNSAISSNFSGLPVSALITNYQQQASGSYSSGSGIYTADVAGYYTMGLNIEGYGVYSIYNYNVSMTYNTNNNTCTMAGKSW